MEECELFEWCYLCWTCTRHKTTTATKNLTITISGMQKQFTECYVCVRGQCQ